jgi:hypothetical protein
MLISIRSDNFAFFGNVCTGSNPKYITHIRNAKEQGDQIGRIFANWAIVYFGQLYENFRISPHFGPFFFSVKLYIDFDQKWVGLHFGRLFLKLIWSPRQCMYLILIKSMQYKSKKNVDER